MSRELEPAATVATPGDVLHPPAKRVKKDPPCPETSPMVPAMASEGWSKWSTLPPDLVRLVADSLLATNDLDCYMCFRAVCPGWRAATDDPRSDASDPRFRPRRWIIFDEVFHNQGKDILLLNADTGRFVHRKLPLCSRDHYIVAVTPNGYLVLADKSPPHAASVLNPLTGVVIRFVAPLPPEVGSAANVLFGHSSLALTLFCASPHNVYYKAGPNTIGFVVEKIQLSEADYGCFRKCVQLLGSVPAFDAVLDDLYSLLTSLDVDKFFHGLRDANDLKWFPSCLDIHMLLVVNTEGSIFVLKKNIEIGKLVALNSISNYAIFMGHQRCLPVNADRFPGVEANCVYYTEILGSSAHICKCNIKDRKVEKISEAADFVKQDKKFVLVADRPLTIIHLLSSYTINNPDSQLALQQIP